MSFLGYEDELYYEGIDYEYFGDEALEDEYDDYNDCSCCCCVGDCYTDYEEDYDG